MTQRTDGTSLRNDEFRAVSSHEGARKLGQARIWTSRKKRPRSVILWVRVEVLKASSPESGHPHSGRARPRRAVVVVPIPPFVGRTLGVALQERLPTSLAAERRCVRGSSRGDHRSSPRLLNGSRCENALALTEKNVVAVPLSTPKSASKMSVMVYQGISQPIRAFRRAMSLWSHEGVGEALCFARIQMGNVGD